MYDAERMGTGSSFKTLRFNEEYLAGPLGSAGQLAGLILIRRRNFLDFILTAVKYRPLKGDRR